MTTVEFIRQELNKKLTDDNYEKSFDEIIKQANEMFKQQIIDTYIECKKEYIVRMDCYPPKFVVDEAKQYYNQRFKNE